MATKKKLPSIPTPRARKPARGKAPAAEQAPDLSHISEGLRTLAWPVADLQFHPDNPRNHSTEHIDEIAASLRTSGQVKNIVASTRLNPPVVCAGNGTLQAALRLGWTHLAVERKALTLEEEHRWLVIDNLTGADPDWNDKLLEVAREMHLGNDPVLEGMMAELMKEQFPAAKGSKDTSEGANGRTEIEATIVCPDCGHRFTR